MPGPQDRQGDTPELVVGIVPRVPTDLCKHAGQDGDCGGFVQHCCRPCCHRAQSVVQAGPGRGFEDRRDHVGRAGLPGEHEREIGPVRVGLGRVRLRQSRQDGGELAAQPGVGEVPAALPP